MKKIVLLIISFVLLSKTTIYAYNYSNIDIDTTELNHFLSDKTNNLNADDIIDMLTLGDISEVIKELYLHFKESFIDIVGYHKNIMFTIIIICFSSMILKLISLNNYGEADVILSCALGIVLINLYVVIYNLALDTITNIFNLLKILLPIFVGVTSFAKNGVMLSEAMFIFFVSIYNFISTKIFLPCITVIAALSISGFSGNYSGKISEKILGYINWIIGISSTLFVCVLKITQVTSTTGDKLMLNGVKYTISKGIPVIGGYVSDSLNGIIGSLFIIKNSMGLLIVFLLLFLCLTPVAYIFVCGLFIKTIYLISDIISPGNSLKVMSDISNCLSELAVILLSAVVSFIVCISIIISVVI